MAQELKTGNWPLFVARNGRPDYSYRYVTGKNGDLDAAEDMISAGGDFTLPTTLRVHAVVSSSVADDAAGTGARTIRVTGIGASFLEVTEDVIMDGTTPVNTSLSYYAVNEAIVLTAGSGGVAAGNITLTAATDSTISNRIATGDNSAEYCNFYVPAGKKAFILGWGGEVDNAAAVSGEYSLILKEFGGVSVVQRRRRIASTGLGGEFNETLPVALECPAKSFIKVRCTAVGTTNSVGQAYMDILVVNA